MPTVLKQLRSPNPDLLCCQLAWRLSLLPGSRDCVWPVWPQPLRVPWKPELPTAASEAEPMSQLPKLFPTTGPDAAGKCSRPSPKTMPMNSYGGGSCPHVWKEMPHDASDAPRVNPISEQRMPVNVQTAAGLSMEMRKGDGMPSPVSAQGSAFEAVYQMQVCKVLTVTIPLYHAQVKRPVPWFDVLAAQSSLTIHASGLDSPANATSDIRKETCCRIKRTIVSSWGIFMGGGGLIPTE